MFSTFAFFCDYLYIRAQNNIYKIHVMSCFDIINKNKMYFNKLIYNLMKIKTK
jgi:hypothetical protein